jgi:hypothetical protein
LADDVLELVQLVDKLASFGVMALYAVIGVALGALIRNQIIAVSALLV